MLKQINCDQFIDKTITFHHGLNAIVGDDIASNSIGKSIMLMIIDFIFGGSSYGSKNKDVVVNVGNHAFDFIFEFNKENFYFKRTTNVDKTVYVCDEKFQIQKDITVSEYCNFLQKKYECQASGLSFRETIGLYLRVYGKENLNEKKPLQHFDKEKANVCILNLIKLFDRYSDIKYLNDIVRNAKDDKETLKRAMNKNLVPAVEKEIYAKNNLNISSLEKKLEIVKNEAIQTSIDTEALLSDEVIEIKEVKSKLVIELNILKNRLKRVNINLSRKLIAIEAELNHLADFFPGFDVKKVNEIELFHTLLAQNLEEELFMAQHELNESIQRLEKEIGLIDQELREKLSAPDAPNFAVNSLINIATKINNLKAINKYYDKENEIKAIIKQSSRGLKEIKEQALAEITSAINHQMFLHNSFIYSDGRRSPTLNITGKDGYRFDTFGDTGTGTAYVGLINYDLSILLLTCLPIIAHDLPLLRNIENDAFSKIVQLYSKSEKQIFIAIDKLSSYDKATSETLNNSAVLKLSKDRLLFRVDWKKVKA